MEVSSNRNSSPLINFFHPVLQPSISCSIVGAEDYPLENLISSDFHKSNRGFIGYLSKPPISLNISLMCPIKLMSIRIWPEVGSLKSTGFDVLTTMAPNGCNEKIASCDNLTESSLVFCRLNDSSVNLDGQPKRCFFFRNLKENTNIEKLTIRIWKTRNSSVPVIKKIEIWGMLTRACRLNEQVLSLWQSRDADGFNYLKPSEPHKSSAITETSSNLISNGIDVPDELLDAITHQIMTVPMTLPSGKTVDQSTLDRFNRIESTWGREPSDIFTGLTFNSNRKPIFNSALKSSIDKFLTQHPNALELNDVPRTIGTVLGNGKRSATSSSSSSMEMECRDPSDSTKRSKYFEFSSNGSDVSGSTKYLSPPTTAVREGNKISCFKCQSVEELYRVKVCEKDYICRSCLCKIDFNKCDGECRCFRTFSRNDVEKYYSSSRAFNYRLS